MRDAARQVVGQGAAEVLLHELLPLPDPGLELLELRKTVLIDRTDIIPGRVFLQGRLRTRCLFTTLERGSPLPPLGTLLPHRGVLAQAAGKLGVHTADIGFAVQISVPGAQPGMEVRVADAFVAADNTQPLSPEAGGLITALAEQSLLRLSVRVLGAEGAVAGPGARLKRSGSGSASRRRPGRGRAAALWVDPAKQV